MQLLHRRWRRRWGVCCMPQGFHHIFERKRRDMLAPVHVEENLRDQRCRSVPPGLFSPILLRQQPPFPKREAPEFLLAYAETLPLKAPEGLPVDPSKGFVSSCTSPFISTGGGVGVAACQAWRMGPMYGMSSDGSA
jgi:hypothetical protein